MAEDFDVEALLDRQLEKPAEKAAPAASTDDRKRGREEDRDDRREAPRGDARSTSSAQQQRPDERERERERERGDRERGDREQRDRQQQQRRRSRSRSRSPPRRAAVDPARDRERDKERERRRREDERADRARREARMAPQEREAIEAERDARTVFAFNMPLRADEDTIIDFFSRAGKVRDVRLITDRNSRKSKGFGYIEFADRNSVPAALALSGTPMMGQTIQVQQTFAEKNRAASATTTTSVVGPTRLYVGSLHFNLAEEDLKLVFEPFGDIDFVQIHREPDTGRSKGYGFVQFRRSEDAKKALVQVNGLEIAGRAIKVGLVNETGGGPGSGMGGGPGGGGMGGMMAGRVDATSMGELDDDDGGGLHMNAQSRAMLMAKLNRGSAGEQVSSTVMVPMVPLGIMPSAGPVGGMPGMPGMPGMMAAQQPGMVQLLQPAQLAAVQAGAPMPTQEAQTTCVMLTNMFDPAQETDPNWPNDIRDDVGEECSKFGSIIFIFVDANSAGHVYIKFGSVPAAQNAINALNRRWFSGRMITAHFINEQLFAQRFPESRR